MVPGTELLVTGNLTMDSFKNQCQTTSCSPHMRLMILWVKPQLFNRSLYRVSAIVKSNESICRQKSPLIIVRAKEKKQFCIFCGIRSSYWSRRIQIRAIETQKEQNFPINSFSADCVGIWTFIWAWKGFWARGVYGRQCSNDKTLSKKSKRQSSLCPSVFNATRITLWTCLLSI